MEVGRREKGRGREGAEGDRVCVYDSTHANISMFVIRLPNCVLVLGMGLPRSTPIMPTKRHTIIIKQSLQGPLYY